MEGEGPWPSVGREKFPGYIFWPPNPKEAENTQHCQEESSHVDLRMGHGKNPTGEILMDRLRYTTWGVTPCTYGQNCLGCICHVSVLTGCAGLSLGHHCYS